MSQSGWTVLVLAGCGVAGVVICVLWLKLEKTRRALRDVRDNRDGWMQSSDNWRKNCEKRRRAFECLTAVISEHGDGVKIIDDWEKKFREQEDGE